ncbi:MAG: competence/damage-inducible protein A [Ruminococcaceae bacterium]|nr:competence/damage-inducible protein A [Oscillospiraceae bacterium]
MNCEILAVGTELLLGNIVNTNAQYLSEQLSSLGIDVYYHTVAGDNKQRLENALKIAFERSDMVITTGGLGPTQDDLTKETAAAYFNEKLVCNEEALEKIKAFFEKRGTEMVASNEKQAYIPENAIIFQNRCGTAPGFLLNKNNKILIMLPGPPSEMKDMFENCALKELKKLQTDTMVSRDIKVYGAGESFIESKLLSFINQKNPTVAPYAKSSEVLLRVTAKAENEEEAAKMADKTVEEICQTIGEYVYGIDIASLEEAAVKELSKKGLKVATAESCTGGGIARRITSVPGASNVIECSFVTYSNDKKNKLLGVSKETLDKFGAVSKETAKEMAYGARVKSGADIGVSATGYAGPDGGDKENPVGTVYIGISTKEKNISEKIIIGRGSFEREYVRHGAENKALWMILKEAKKLLKK